MRSSLEHLKPSNQIEQLKEKLAPYPERFALIMQQIIAKRKEHLTRISAHLQSIHPHHLLTKGYSILFSEKDGSIILSTKDLLPNQPFTALLQDGKIYARAITPQENHEPRNTPV
jgi:exodeoxyribonuclease VII large subunit